MRAHDLPFVVKVCGITNVEDAHAAIEAGANALGLNFFPESPRYIGFEKAREISKAIAGDYLRVGVFVNPKQAEVRWLAGEVPLDVVQVHGNARGITAEGRWQVWRGISPDTKLAKGEEKAANAFLMDTPSMAFGGSGKTFDWGLARGRSYRVILAGGLDASNVAEAIREAQPWGVDACSRLEARRGKKDVQRMQEYVAAALKASHSVAQRGVA